MENDETHVTRDFSSPISLSPGGLGGARPGGRAVRCSVRAILSGSNSLMSTNSRACIRRTNLAGMGTILLAILNGRVLSFSQVTGMMELIGAPVVPPDGDADAAAVLL